MMMRFGSTGALALAAACVVAAPAQAATTVYASQSAFLAATSGTVAYQNWPNAVLTTSSAGAYSTTVGQATITSPTRLSVATCSTADYYAKCLVSSTAAAAAAIDICANQANIAPGDTLYHVCLADVGGGEAPARTDVAVAGTVVGLLIEGANAEGGNTIAYDANGTLGTAAIGQEGFIGFSGDQPLSITLASSSSLFIRTVFARPGAVTPVAAAVPEPASWATMLLGFAMIGGVVRRRSVRLALPAA